MGKDRLHFRLFEKRMKHIIYLYCKNYTAIAWSSVVQWLGYIAFTDETRVQFPAGESIFSFFFSLSCTFNYFFLSFGFLLRPARPLLVLPLSASPGHLQMFGICGHFQMPLFYSFHVENYGSTCYF